MKRIYLIALVVCMILIASAFVDSFLAPEPSLQITKNKSSVGVCLHLEDFIHSTEEALVDLGVRWVRIDWQIGKMGLFMQEMDKNGINVLGIIDHVTMKWDQNFTLEDWQGNLSAIMASDEATGVDAWEIWNEPNAVQFFYGYMDGSPQHYFDMLKVAYSTIKFSSNTPVVCAGLSPNQTWLEWHNNLLSLGAQKFFDIQGMHLYGDLSTNLEMIDSISSGKPIWVTEIGKPSQTEDYTEADQANYVADNITPLIQKVDKAFWYEMMDGHNADPPKENYFGLIDTAYNKKPAYEEFKSILEALPQQTAG